jgi:hypothetical protein
MLSGRSVLAESSRGVEHGVESTAHWWLPATRSAHRATSVTCDSAQQDAKGPHIPAKGVCYGMGEGVQPPRAHTTRGIHHAGIPARGHIIFLSAIVLPALRGRAAKAARAQHAQNCVARLLGHAAQHDPVEVLAIGDGAPHGSRD